MTALSFNDSPPHLPLSFCREWNDNEYFWPWSLRIIASLETSVIQSVIYGLGDEFPMSAGSTQLLYTEESRIAQAVIVTCLRCKLLKFVQNAASPKEMWTELSKTFQAAESACETNLLTALFITSYEFGKVLGDYLAEVECSFKRLKDTGRPDPKEI